MLSGNVLIPTGVEEGSALSSYCLSLSHTSFPPSFWSDHQVVLWWPAQWSQCDTAFKWFTVISLIRLQLISLIINECVSELSYSEGFIWNQPSLAPLQFLALEKNIMPLTSMFVCVCVCVCFCRILLILTMIGQELQWQADQNPLPVSVSVSALVQKNNTKFSIHMWTISYK